MGAISTAGGGVPAGTVAHFAMSAAPAGWLKCNGAAVSRALYAGLFAAIGTSHGAGDGATTFNLPDHRGEFLRGLDDGRGVDAARVLGSAQGSQNAAHQHYTGSASVYSGGGGVGPDYTGTANAGGALTTSQGGAEARPCNVAELICIKY